MAASMLAGCGSSQKAAEITATPAAESTEAAAETKAEEASEAGSEVAASDYEFKDTITLICPVKAGGDTIETPVFLLSTCRNMQALTLLLRT